jgi:hypothetical protein
MTKQLKKGEALKHSLNSMYERLTVMADEIPDGYDFEDPKSTEEDKERYGDLIHNIWCIEEEWILNPKLRAELSVIQCGDTHDYDDDDDD